MFLKNLITNIWLDFKHSNYMTGQLTLDNSEIKGQEFLRVVDLLGFAWPSFWIHPTSPFLWSWQVEFWTRLSVPLRASEDSNCSKTLTICQNSGLFSGCKDQHCSIKARREAGQSAGITGLEFWKEIKKKKHKFLLLRSCNLYLVINTLLIWTDKN